MRDILFNSSMPRSGSTLLQNIFNQNPHFYATPTDGVIELLAGARERFTTAPEFKAAIDQELADNLDDSIIGAREIAFFPPMTGG